MNLPTLARRSATSYGAAVLALVALAELINRLWVASVFWKSALTKIQSWSSTLFLFEYEYQVPLLPPELAAYLGTAVELTFPVLLALGLAGRVAAGVLVLFNITAALSYPALTPAGIHAHMIWGVMLMIPLLRGPGWLSADALIAHLLRIETAPGRIATRRP